MPFPVMQEKKLPCVNFSTIVHAHYETNQDGTVRPVGVDLQEAARGAAVGRAEDPAARRGPAQGPDEGHRGSGSARAGRHL